MNKEYWVAVGKRIIDIILSVKVLTLTAIIVISSAALWTGKMTGTEWASLNGMLISAVIAIREGFKVSRIKAIANGTISEEEKTKVLEETRV